LARSESPCRLRTPGPIHSKPFVFHSCANIFCLRPVVSASANEPSFHFPRQEYRPIFSPCPIIFSRTPSLSATVSRNCLGAPHGLQYSPLSCCCPCLGAFALTPTFQPRTYTAPPVSFVLFGCCSPLSIPPARVFIAFYIVWHPCACPQGRRRVACATIKKKFWGGFPQRPPYTLSPARECSSWCRGSAPVRSNEF
jgi:hypothetical protein